MSRFDIASLLLPIWFALMMYQVSYVAALAASNSVTQSKMSSFSPHFIPGTIIYASKIGGDEAHRLAKEGVFIDASSKNNYIDLANGNILLNPEKDTIVGTSAGNIYIGAQAIVFIIKCGNELILYDLFQAKPKQVAVILGTHKMVMSPGHMILLTRQNTDDFEKLEFNCHGIAYCNAHLLNSYPNNGEEKAFVADFSIASALVVVQPLKQLMASNNKQDNLVLGKLVKSAAIRGDSDIELTPSSVEVASTGHSR